MTRSRSFKGSELLNGTLIRNGLGLDAERIVRTRALVSLRSTKPVAGRVLVGDPGFLLAHDPDTVRAPDLAFLSNERHKGEKIAEGFLEGVPDLAVEIRSSNDRTVVLVGPDDALDGTPVLPGFVLPLASLWVNP